ncbi:hypothetical protein [Nonomuraea sp. NPDC050643]|uniref:hypothetical protein n=1 Tax=Nonomuraea sp. NPDC050643 TaxID=3155660 RepID=UPI0033E8C8C4
MPTRRGFIRTAGGAAALAVPGATVLGEAASGSASLGGAASGAVDGGEPVAERLTVFRELARTAADGLGVGVAGAAELSAYYRAASAAERAVVDRALDAVGSGLAGLAAGDRVAYLAKRLRGPEGDRVEAALGLLRGGAPYPAGVEHGRLLGRALLVHAAQAGAPREKAPRPAFVI